MSDTPDTRVPAQRSSNQDRVIAFGVLAIALLVVASLWIISRDAPSSVQQESVTLITADVTGEEGCSNFAEFWTTGSGVNVPVDAIEAISNCRLSNTGEWFVPVDATDPRLSSRSVPDSAQIAVTSDLADALADDLIELQNTLPVAVTESLAENYDDVNQPVFGHTKRGRTDLTVKRNRYVRITQAFLIDPNRIVIADYVGWVMKRRTDAVGVFEASCRADPDLAFILRACTGMRNEFTVNQIPLLWDLTDPVLINEYLISQSNDPLAIPVPTAETTT